MTTTSKVRLSGGPVGLDIIEIDGEDVKEKVQAVSVSYEPGSIVDVHVTLIPDVDLEVDGAIYIHNSVSNEAVMEILQKWILSRDASEIERVALSRLGMDETGPFSAKVLEVLGEMAGMSYAATS